MVTNSEYYMFIVWNIDNDQENKYKTRFHEGKVYRIKANKWIGGGLYFYREYLDDAQGLYVTEVMWIVEDCQELEKIYEEFIIFVIVQHKTLGDLLWILISCKNTKC